MDLRYGVAPELRIADDAQLRPSSWARHADEVRALAEHQYGVVARRQLLALGVTHAAVRHRIHSGALVPVGHGVYALGHRPTANRARWMIATLEPGEHAVLGGRSAAAHWGLISGDHNVTTVLVPVNGSRRRRAGLVIRRCSDLPRTEWTVHLRIRVTTVARALVDLGQCCRPAELRRAVEQADRLELFDLREIEPILARRRGRPGVAVLERLLADAAAHGLSRTRSTLEADFLELCRDHDLPRPQVNRWDGGREIDFRWPDHGRIVVETDGWEWHRTRAAFERDSERSQTLAAEGWTLLRVTWRQLDRAPATVAARLRAVLGQARVAGER